MRKHFRQIAAGLSLAMAVSVAAPASQTIYAAETAYDVTLGTPERREITEETLKVGEKIDLNFYGVKDWNQNKANYKCKWAVSGDAVTVNNRGVVTAVKAGTAVVNLSVTDTATGVSHNITPATITVTEKLAEGSEKLVDNNGCSDVITAVDYTSDKGVITSYNEDTDTEEVLVYLHKNGLKFYEGGESNSAIFGSSLYGKYFDSDDGNPCKYAISYKMSDWNTTDYSLENLWKRLEDYHEEWLERLEEQFGENTFIDISDGIYEFNGTKIAYSRAQYKEGAWGQDDYEYTPAYIEYSFYQDIGLGEYIRIDVTSYDVTEDMDTVLGRVLLFEGDYTINQ